MNYFSNSDLKTENQVKEITQKDTPWDVYIYNDPVNLINYVILVLKQIFGFNNNKARKLTFVAHNEGKAIVWSGNKEKAEFYVQQLHMHQITSSLKKN